LLAASAVRKRSKVGDGNWAIGLSKIVRLENDPELLEAFAYKKEMKSCWR
jgi:hypothetical protein